MKDSKIERAKRYSISVAERLVKEKFSQKGWDCEHSFLRHKFHAEKIEDYNKIIKKLAEEDLK